MNLGKLIQALLSENETVIIPEFGAFVTKYKPAEIGENEIKPPSKEISFTTLIKNNDGLLVAAVARKGKIALAKALLKIEKERENILFQLDKGEKVIFDSVGEIFYNAQNELQFTPESNYLSFSEEFGFGTISTEDLPEKEIDIIPKPVDLIEEIQEESKYSETEIVENYLKNSPSNISDQRVSDNKITKKKKRSKSVLWLLLIVPLVFALYFGTQKKNKPTPNVKIEVVPTDTQAIENNFIANDTLFKSDSILNIAQKEISETVGVKYYVVGGGFKNEENVEKFMLQLKATGIEGINLGKRGNLHLVGIAAFETEQEAYKALNENLKTYPGWNLWIHKK